MLLVFAVVVGTAVLVAGCGGESSMTSSPTADVSNSPSVVPSPLAYPSTAAGEQLAWVVGRMNDGTPFTREEIEAHFSSSFLKAVPADQLAVVLAQLAAGGKLRLGDVLVAGSPTALVARLDRSTGEQLKASIAVEEGPQRRIVGLLFQPYTETPRPTSWKAIDDQVAGLAAQASLVAVDLDSQDTPIHQLDAERVGAIGSAFKLYVLGALGEAVENGSAAWNERLAIRDAWKSLPSGDMRDESAGTKFTLRHYAEQMISVSDNTATDHVMWRVGRAAVEARLRPMGASAPERMLPLPTTREMFVLKLSAPDDVRRAYIAGDTATRRTILKSLAALPLSVEDAADWTAPRDIDTIEWFASPADLVRAHVALQEMARTKGLEPIRAILAINPGVSIDQATWPYVAFKGGSEPGVLCFSWYMERADGRRFALALVLNDGEHAIDTPAAVTVAEGAFDLLAKVP